MDIKILGRGCDKCEALERTARRAVEELSMVATFEHVTDPAEIASWGVMHTPALVVDDQVVVSGRVPTSDDLKALLGP